MKIYVFGNTDFPGDDTAYNIAESLKDAFPEIDFIYIKPNEDVPFDNGEDVVILDVVLGLAEPSLITGEKALQVVLPPRTSAHDFDLGFQLKYLQKLGKLGEVSIIGLPQDLDVVNLPKKLLNILNEL